MYNVKCILYLNCIRYKTNIFSSTVACWRKKIYLILEQNHNFYFLCLHKIDCSLNLVSVSNLMCIKN